MEVYLIGGLYCIDLEVYTRTTLSDELFPLVKFNLFPNVIFFFFTFLCPVPLLSLFSLPASSAIFLTLRVNSSSLPAPTLPSTVTHCSITFKTDFWCLSSTTKHILSFTQIHRVSVFCVSAPFLPLLSEAETTCWFYDWKGDEKSED